MFFVVRSNDSFNFRLGLIKCIVIVISDIMNKFHKGYSSLSRSVIYFSAQIQDDLRQVQISPTLHHQAQAMLSLLEQFDWSQFSVVYTAHAGHMDFLNALRMLIHERNKYLDDNALKKSKTK